MKATEEECDHMLHRYILLAALFVLLLVFVDHVVFAQISVGLRAYDPGGPVPAMKEAAKTFEQKTEIPVVVTAGLLARAVIDHPQAIG